MKPTLLAVLLLLSTYAMAKEGGGSSGVGGGGSAIILPDDTVILADPYVEKESGRPHLGIVIELDEKIKEELARSLMLLNNFSGRFNTWIHSDFNRVYGAPLTDNYYEHFKSNQLINSSVEFRLVDEIPSVCPYREPRVVNLPTGARIEIAACTSGKYTWIRRSIFKKMTVREQAKLLIHERLRAHLSKFGPLTDTDISMITDSLEILLRTMNLQIKREFPVLTEEEVSKLEDFKELLSEISIFPTDEKISMHNYTVFANGAGLVSKDAKINPSAYISAGTVVGKNVEMAANSKMLFASRFFADASSAKLAAGSEIHSIRGNKAAVVLGENSKVIEIDMYGASLIVGNNSLAHKSVLGFQTVYPELRSNFVLGNNVILDKTQFWKIDSFAGTVVGTYELEDGVIINGLQYADFRFRYFARTIFPESLLVATGAVLGLATGGIGPVLVGTILFGTVGIAPSSLFIDRTHHSKVIFKTGFELQTESPSICKNRNDNVFVDNFGETAEIKSVEDLIKRCKRKLRRKQR